MVISFTAALRKKYYDWRIFTLIIQVVLQYVLLKNGNRVKEDHGARRHSREDYFCCRICFWVLSPMSSCYIARILKTSTRGLKLSTVLLVPPFPLTRVVNLTITDINFGPLFFAMFSSNPSSPLPMLPRALTSSFIPTLIFSCQLFCSSVSFILKPIQVYPTQQKPNSTLSPWESSS